MNKQVKMSELSTLMTEALEKGGEVILTVTGTSMQPLLHHRRDKVCLVKVNEHGLKKYDLPLFIRPDGKYVLHRIVEVRWPGYVTMGDNRRTAEYPVLPSQIVAVVKGFWRNGRYISCEGFGYQIYSRLWVSLYPLRRLCLKRKWFLINGVRLFMHRNGDKNNEG